MPQSNLHNQQQFLERLARKSGELEKESTIVTSPGSPPAIWAAKVVSLQSYNYYNITPVEFAPPGIPPTQVGNEFVAINLAESFFTDGTLSAGTYVIAIKISGNYVFYAPV